TAPCGAVAPATPGGGSRQSLANQVAGTWLVSSCYTSALRLQGSPSVAGLQHGAGLSGEEAATHERYPGRSMRLTTSDRLEPEGRREPGGPLPRAPPGLGVRPPS